MTLRSVEQIKDLLTAGDWIPADLLDDFIYLITEYWDEYDFSDVSTMRKRALQDLIDNEQQWHEVSNCCGANVRETWICSSCWEPCGVEIELDDIEI